MFKRRKTPTIKGGVKGIPTQAPYWDLFDNIMVLKSGRLAYGVYFNPPTHLHFTPDDLERRQAPLKSVVDLAVPDGETFRTYTSLRSALEEEIQDIKAYAAACPDPVLRELSLERAAMLEAKIVAGEVSHWHFFATCTVTPPSDLRFSIDEPPSEKELRHAIENAQSLQAAAVAQLGAAGFTARPMSRQDVFAECFYWLNPGWPAAPMFIPQEERTVHSVRGGQADVLTLTRQLGMTTIDNQDKQPIVGDRYVEVMSLGRLPEYTETGYLRNLTDGLEGTYYVVMEATRENDFDVSNELEKSKNDLWTRVKSPGVVPNGKATNLLEEIEAAQRLEGVESRFEAGVSIVLTASTPDEMARMKRRARGNAVTLRAGAPVSYGFQSIAQYWNLAPFTDTKSGFLFRPFTSNIVDLFPPVAPWAGFKEGAITFQSRDNSLVKFDLRTKETKTPHFAIYAPPGTGKTVLALSLLTAHLTKYQDSVVVVSDAKEDFKYFFSTLSDSAIINFGYNSPVRLNVFDLEDGATHPDSEKMSALKSFLYLLISKPEDAVMADALDVALTEAIMMCYLKFERDEYTPQIADLRKMLEIISNYSDTGTALEPKVVEAARDAAIGLRKALGSSPIAPFVDCQSNVKITSRRIYLNTHGIGENDELMRRVAHHIVRSVMWNTAKKYPRPTAKWMFTDEFENQIKAEHEIEDIRSMLRVFRSYGVIFGIGTQDPQSSKGFGALMDSFSHLFIGGYSRSIARGVVEVLSLPKAMETKLPELSTVRGKYSEFALLSNARPEENRGERIGDVIRVEESKLALWLFASGADEVEIKDRYVEAAGGNVLQGLRQLVRDQQGRVNA
ncbi:VirB4 family type IV secretion system protein [Deinococcus enclensis]|uniref:Uncharacterized protein n=1 Tax=Deinococcus enclensis TaxID=1049582 RepID=A0ABT9MHQ8_9DEIO|nr:hypothetical protein [Deinococcus enclensis]MDP9766123.1 hypothetical protein [Deinococcus enclensis]